MRAELILKHRDAINARNTDLLTAALLVGALLVAIL